MKKFGDRHMKKIVLAAFAAAIAVPAAAAPGDSASTTGTATAEIVSPIAIVHDAATLNFGTIVPGTGAGTVTVDASTGVATGDAEATVVTGATSSADSFTVTGDAGRGFDISTGGGSVISGANAMTFTTTPSAATGTLTGGTANFTVGGALSVGANQAGGVYSGTYTASVSYN
ncbi:MAG: DUF4402 domain-containing protein [Alphaproteobacteria bacterium]|nr:MAG: DUF4402 domain-containing protein [Alphaproteobacteria bacterium]